MDNVFNPFCLTGKTILVTGASSGIGQAIAIACSKMGGNIILTGRNQGKLNETLRQMNTGCHEIIMADLTNEEDRLNLVHSLPALDGIVYNAGMGHRKVCKFIEKEDIEKIMNINFTASVLLQSDILSNKKLKKELQSSLWLLGQHQHPVLEMPFIVHPKEQSYLMPNVWD